MAERYLFFNALEIEPGVYDREYQSQDFAEYFGSVLSSGLLHTDEVPGMTVTVEQGTMNTIVSKGKAIMRGHLYENTTPLTLEHSIPEANLDRIDRVVLRLDSRQSQRNIKLHVKEGAPANVPVAPALQRDNLIYEISLAKIYVHRNTSSLSRDDVTDERLNEDVCGLTNSMLTVPTSQFQEQWDLYFNAKRDEINSESASILQQMADDLVRFNNDWDAWFSNQQTEGFVMVTDKGIPGGVPELDGGGKVPIEQLPPMDYVPIIEKGEPDGVATLDSEGIIPNRQLGWYSPGNTSVFEIGGLVSNFNYGTTSQVWREGWEFVVPVTGKLRVTGILRGDNVSFLGVQVELRSGSSIISPTVAIGDVRSSQDTEFTLDFHTNVFLNNQVSIWIYVNTVQDFGATPLIELHDINFKGEI